MPYLHIKSNQTYIPDFLKIIKTDLVYDLDEMPQVSVKHHQALLQEERKRRVLPVYRFTLDGVYVDVHSTKQAVATSLNANHSIVTSVLDGIDQNVCGYRLSYDRHPVWERTEKK